jgi:hypothetical protein
MKRYWSDGPPFIRHWQPWLKNWRDSALKGKEKDRGQGVIACRCQPAGVDASPTTRPENLSLKDFGRDPRERLRN